jgi:hypothetical protein
MVETLGYLIIVGVSIVMFGVIVLPLILHDSDTGANLRK